MKLLGLTPLEIIIILLVSIMLLFVVIRVVFTAIFISWWRMRDWWLRKIKNQKEEP